MISVFSVPGPKPVIGMYDEINSFVSYVKDAAEGGSSKEMAYVLVGEPGNGKTYFVDFLCEQYRHFLSQPRKPQATPSVSVISTASEPTAKSSRSESQTYEDPMVLAMNLCGNPEESRAYLNDKIGFDRRPDRQAFTRITGRWAPAADTSGTISAVRTTAIWKRCWSISRSFPFP